MAREVYVSTDIESDGPIPGPHSMLSFGSVAFDDEGNELGWFSRNLVTLEGAQGHPDTMKWWATQSAAWEACRADPRDPATAMKDYVGWLEALPGKPVFVGYPVAFDFLFVHWYLHRFVGRSPFSHSALDMKTLAMTLLGEPFRFREATKRNMPRRWFPPIEHNHIAVDDAREQGLIFLAMRNELRTAKKG
ncbi:MAG: exonuclease [Deltaproteobacteria bacterium]|nr:exonuclease [Deltaproteobacteria bacterium]